MTELPTTSRHDSFSIERARRVPMLAMLGVFALTSLIVGSSGCGAAQSIDEEAREQSDYHYQLAMGHYRAREIPVAIGELRTALEHNPDNAQALFLKGFIYQGRRDYQQAIRLYTRALEAREGWFEVKNNLGAVYLETEQWEEAAELFRELTRSPTYSSPGHAHNNLGWALYRMGERREALEQFQMAIMYQPEHCLAYNNQGIVQEEFGNTRDAKRSWEQAIRRCNSYAEPRFRLGRLLLAEDDDVPRAIELLEECVDIGPDTVMGRRCQEYLDVVD